MSASSFHIRIVKNCRKFTKKCYHFQQPINRELIAKLEPYGLLHINEFSQYSPLAKDSFHIRLLDDLEISGAIGDHLLYIVLSKKLNQNLFDELEAILLDWGNRNH